MDCNFVAGRDQALDGDAFSHGTADQLGAGNQDIVLGVESDGGIHEKVSWSASSELVEATLKAVARSSTGSGSTVGVNKTFWAAT
jgi:hypothetical protein